MKNKYSHYQITINIGIELRRLKRTNDYINYNYLTVAYFPLF